MRIAVGDHRHLMVHLVDEPAHVVRGKVLELRVARRFVEVASEVVGMIVVRLVAGDHVPAGAPHGAVERDVQRLGALRRDDAYDLAGLDARAPSESEVDENGRVALEVSCGGV